MSEDQDRTNPASPIQMEQASQRGDVPNSVELGGAIQSLGGLLIVFLMVGGIGSWLVSWTKNSWASGGLQVEQVTAGMQGTLFQMGGRLAPMLALLFLLALVGFWLQSGFVFKPDRAMPKLDRLSPTRFAGQGIFRKMLMALVALPKMFISIALAICLIWYQRDQFFELSLLGPDVALEKGFGLVLFVSFQIALILLLFGLVDYGVEWVARTQRLQMSDQQVRDEQRMQEGDPVVQSRRRQRQQELSRGPRPAR